MKAKHILPILLLVIGCRKEADIFIQKKTLSQSSVSNAKTDGTVSVSVNILPPVTSSQFLPNVNNGSNTEFEIFSKRHIFLEQVSFAASDLIYSATINGQSLPNSGGYITYMGGYINANNGTTLNVHVNYNPVDNSNSGSIAQLKISSIYYRTDEEQYFLFQPQNSGIAQPMCLVNNISHLKFVQYPVIDTLRNGYSKISELKLTGNKSWTLNQLPLQLFSYYYTEIPKSKLIVYDDNGKVPTIGDSMELSTQYAYPVIKFTNGYKHNPQQTETLKIYANVYYDGNHHIMSTSIYPLSGFVWSDALGTRINGEKNSKFFKNNSGYSYYQSY